MLWIKTAKKSLVDFFKLLCGPSSRFVPLWKCGTNLSIKTRNPPPSKKPTAAGNQ